MLIKSLEVLNFQHHKKLTIDDIPESGIIAISGEDELSRASIGEAICFALFGRTPLQDKQTLHKVIHQGSQNSKVTLSFKASDGKKYSLWRKVNKNGQVNVKLTHLDTATVIKDSEEVTKGLDEILGFNFETFTHFFYCSQTELTSTQHHSDALEKIAGITDYSKITKNLELANQKSEALITELQPQANSKQEKLDDIDLDETWLPELIDAEETLEKEQKDRAELSKDLDDNKDFYSTQHAQFHKTKRIFNVFSFIKRLSLYFSAFFGALHLINHYYPTQFIELLTNLSKLTNNLEQPVSNYLADCIIALLLVAIVSLIFCKKQKSKMADLNNQAKDFTELLEIAHQYSGTLTETPLPERVVQSLYEDHDDINIQIITDQTQELKPLFDNKNYEASPEDISNIFTSIVEPVKTQENNINVFNKNILNAVYEEKIRTTKAGELRSILQTLNKDLDKTRYKIDTNRIAINMMQRASSDFIHNFNQRLTDISKTTRSDSLSDTDNNIKMKDDFTVHVFSGDEDNYIDFDKALPDAQQQATLALRITTAEQLAINSANKEQFIFLDQALTHFDKEEGHTIVENLPDISGSIQQIWVSETTHSDDIEVAKRINC